MTPPTLFLTGGTGFLGHHLVPQLVAQGYCVRLLVRGEPGSSSRGVEYVRGDITDADSVRRGMEGCQYVVHGAGMFRFWGSEDDFYQINVLGTKNVVNAALQVRVTRLVHISTIAVVGQAPAGQPLTEMTECRPLDAYQRSKLAGETVVREARVPSVVLRPGAFYGPGSTYGFNRLFIQDPMRGVRIQVDGGRRLIFPVFVPDVAWAVGAALEMVEAEGVYNICDQPRSHQEINRVVSQLLGISPFRISVPRAAILGFAGVLEFLSHYTHREPFFPLNLRHYVFNDWPVSCARARVDLGFQPTPMEEGLRQTVAWFKDRSR